MQCCVNYCCTAKWLSYTLNFWILFPFISYQSTKYSLNSSISCNVLTNVTNYNWHMILRFCFTDPLPSATGSWSAPELLQTIILPLQHRSTLSKDSSISFLVVHYVITKPVPHIRCVEMALCNIPISTLLKRSTTSCNDNL